MLRQPGRWAQRLLLFFLLALPLPAQDSPPILRPEDVGLPSRFPLPVESPVVQSEFKKLLAEESGFQSSVQKAYRANPQTNRRLRDALEFFRHQPGRAPMIRRIRRGTITIHHYKDALDRTYGYFSQNRAGRLRIYLNTAIVQTPSEYVLVLDHEYKHAAGLLGNGRVGSELTTFRSESRLALRAGLPPLVKNPRWVARAGDDALRRRLIRDLRYHPFDDALYRCDREWKKGLLRWYQKQLRDCPKLVKALRSSSSSVRTAARWAARSIPTLLIVTPLVLGVLDTISDVEHRPSPLRPTIMTPDGG